MQKKEQVSYYGDFGCNLKKLLQLQVFYMNKRRNKVIILFNVSKFVQGRYQKSMLFYLLNTLNQPYQASKVKINIDDFQLSLAQYQRFIYYQQMSLKFISVSILVISLLIQIHTEESQQNNSSSIPNTEIETNKQQQKNTQQSINTTHPPQTQTNKTDAVHQQPAPSNAPSASTQPVNATLPPHQQSTKATLPPSNKSQSNDTSQKKVDDTSSVHSDDEQSEDQKQSEQPLRSRFGGLSKQFLDLLNPGGDQNLNNSLINKLIEKLGITDPKELKQQYGVTTKQEEMKKQSQKAFKQYLSSWVQAERDQASETYDKGVYADPEPFDSFSFTLQKQQQRKLKMVVRKDRPENFTFTVKMYYEVGENYLPPNYPAEDNYLKMTIGQNNKTFLEKNVYVKRFFEWNQFHQDGIIDLTFKNNVQYPILVMADIEELPRSPKDFPKEEKIDPSSEKLLKILNDIKRNHTANAYQGKADIGFYDEGEKHMESYLLISGIETLTILLTCYIQVYFLRKLIGNEIIMV